jgi:multidrug efflux system membrane fusion protein
MRVAAASVGFLTLLTACSEGNRYVAPPPPKVTVQLPLQESVAPYLEATGNAAAVNTVKLVARVQGYRTAPS